MNIQQAKRIPITEVLNRLGFQPKKKRQAEQDWWYLSPFRMEKEPSFHVNTLKNIWYDFAGQGGNILDFVMQYQQCDLSAALQFLEALFAGNATSTYLTPATGKDRVSVRDKLQLERVQDLQHPALIQYLQRRNINVTIAKDYVKQVHFFNPATQRSYYTLGFRNGRGGFELRNPYFKGSIGAKGLSWLGDRTKVHVSLFEGFMDFLSYLTYRNTSLITGEVLILHSLSQLAAALELIAAQHYGKIYTFFDNDTAGMASTRKVQNQLGDRVITCNHLYEGSQDLNAHLIKMLRTC